MPGEPTKNVVQRIQENMHFKQLHQYIAPICAESGAIPLAFFLVVSDNQETAVAGGTFGVVGDWIEPMQAEPDIVQVSEHGTVEMQAALDAWKQVVQIAKSNIQIIQQHLVPAIQMWRQKVAVIEQRVFPAMQQALNARSSAAVAAEQGIVELTDALAAWREKVQLWKQQLGLGSAG